MERSSRVKDRPVLLDDRGVAPIIAEVLLVAMTVALAGSVFYMAGHLATQAAISSHPFVAFGSVTLHDGVATIPIASVSSAFAPGNYKVNLAAGSVMGTAVALGGSDVPVTVLVGATAFTVAWHDVSGNGALSGGDPITVSAANGALPSGTNYAFFLFWSDGTLLQSTAWSG